MGGVVEDAMFIVNDDGITFRGMDPSHVALLDITFPKSSFEKLESTTSFFGIRVVDFKMVMNTASNGDIVELTIVNEGIMKISINGSLSMEYNLKLIQKQNVNVPIPKTEYKAKLSLVPGTFTRILSNIERVSKYVTIHCNSNGVEFSGSGDVGDAKISIAKDNPDLKSITSNEDTSSIYSLEFMTKVIRDIGKASKLVNLEYATKNPVHVEFEMPSKASVNYYLAPRVD